MTTIYHCTRLLHFEISDIQRDGLKPLRPDHLIQRIERAHDLEEITAEQRDHLIANNQASSDAREGKLVGYADTAQLKDPGDAGFVLSFWGGEALANEHEDDPLTGPTLWTMGTACIVEITSPNPP